MSAYYDPDHSSVERFSNPSNVSEPTSNDRKPADAHLTPSHAFPPTLNSEIVDPEHARASLSKSDSINSVESYPQHYAEKGYDSCASCRAKGKKPFQGHRDGEDGCNCIIKEGSVPTETSRGKVEKRGN